MTVYSLVSMRKFDIDDSPPQNCERMFKRVATMQQIYIKLISRRYEVLGIATYLHSHIRTVVVFCEQGRCHEI